MNLTVAIAGNPNCGKTSIFNRLTGTAHSVANYPGVTVEQKIGRTTFDGREITLVDLPGTYSLTAFSADELVARNYVIESRPRVVIDVVDAANLERNLYLTVQYMEMRVPLVIALNMIDVAERRGLTVDTALMSRLLGIPVVATIGNRGTGMHELMQAVVSVADQTGDNGLRAVSYGHEVETEVDRLAAVIARENAITSRYPANWVAVKLIEGDPLVRRRVREIAEHPDAIELAARQSIAAIEAHFGESAEVILAERRYGFAAGVVRECVRAAAEARQDLTDRIDAIVCDRFLGLVILVGVIYGLFAAVFKVADDWNWLFGRSPTGWVHWFFDVLLAGLVDRIEPSMPVFHSLLRDGIISGVGGVVGFVPLIAVMFFFVAILEDTGYIARVAFVLDRALRVFGLQGKSILAMIISGGLGGGGCAVPGVMATRTLREEKDRLVTMLVAPLMNCGAKMTVHLMLIAAFFSHRKPQMLFALWIASWVIALSAAWVLRKVLITGPQTPFVMELPAYHVPTLRGVLLHTWERTWLYLRKAGTVILAINIVIWAAMYFPHVPGDPSASRNERSRAQLAGSIAGRLGSALVPVTRLAGFDWKDNIALVGGFAAKEAVIGTLGTAYSMGRLEEDEYASVSEHLASDPTWSPLRAVAMIVFVMVYAPCFVTLVTIRRESGKWRWALFSTTYTTILAFVLATAIYQIGSALGWGVS